MESKKNLSFKGEQEMGKDYGRYTLEKILYPLAGEEGSSPLQERSEQKAPQEIPCQLGTVAWTVGRKSLLADTECVYRNEAK